MQPHRPPVEGDPVAGLQLRAGTSPLIWSRPDLIHCSTSRREPTPAAASTFWIRSVGAAGGARGVRPRI
jgi:hypothetical protein